MALSPAYRILWCAGIVSVSLPHLNLGLLSDYKICGDSECASLMSRVQAIRDHHGKDCRYLSFRRGDTFFVYHKLTGKRKDLWAGSIDKQFGHFPKDAVQEEQVHATVEKVVETQKSDFFCMDEFGYPIDSSHLDSDDDDDYVDKKIPNREPETTQTTPYTDNTNTESPSTSTDVSTESPVSEQDADGTSTEPDENKSAGDAAPGTHEEAQEAPAALNEQGGSASSSWLSSSVTGWLGLAKEDEPGNLAEGENKDESKGTQAEASLTSSVTGWLGLGQEGKPESREESGETADSFASTMTGWLGFGGEEKADNSEDKEQDEERGNDEEQEPEEKFRSRRMSLDLEGSQLHNEEKKEMGTLDWLGNGLSSTLGFGLTNQESGHLNIQTTTEREGKETTQEEEEQPAPSSWLDMGIGDILGFRKDKSEVDESAGSGFKETAEDKTLEEPTGSENVDTSQSQPTPTGEVRTQTSNESTLPEDAASEVNRKETPPQTKLEEKSQVEGGMSSMLNSFLSIGSEEEEKDNVLDDNKKEKNILDGERSAEMEGKDHQMSKSVENEGEDNYREPGEVSLGSDFSLNSNSMGLSVGEAEEDKTENVREERAAIPDQTDSTEESTNMPVALGAGSADHEGEGIIAETDVLYRENATTHSQVSAGAEESSGESEPFFSSGAAEERNEPISNEDDTLTAHSIETSVDHSDSLAMIGNNTETEIHRGKLGQDGDVHPVEGSFQEFELPHSTDRSPEMMYENAPKEEGRMFSTSESTAQMDNNADQDSVFPHMQQGATQSDGDLQKLKETVKDTENDSENKLQPAQPETIGFEKYSLHESLKSIGSKTEAEEVEELKEEDEQREVGELKEEAKREQLKEVVKLKAQEKQQEVWEKKQDGIEELKEEEKHQEVKDIMEDGRQEEMEELKEEEKQQEVKDIMEDGRQEEMEELKEEEKQQEVKEIMEDGRQEEMEELKEEEKQQEVKEIREDVKQEEVVEVREKKKQEDIEEVKKEEKKDAVKELHADEKKDKMEEINEEKKREEVEDLLKEEKQQQIEELEEEQQDEVETLKEGEKMEELKEVEEVKKKGKKEVEEKDVSYHFEVEMENTDRPVSESNERQEENNLESGFSKTQTEKRQNVEEQREQEVEEEKDEMKEEEAEAMLDMGNVEGERRDKEEEGSLKEEDEKRNDDGKDKKNSESNVTGNKDISSNNANGMSDLNALGVSQMGKIEYTDNALLYSGESGQNSPPNQILLGQTAENKDDQLYSSEAKTTDLSDDIVLHQEDTTEPEDTEISSNGIFTQKKTEQIHSDHEIDTEVDTDGEERGTNDVRVNEDADMHVKKSNWDTVGTELRAEGGMEVSVSSSDPVGSPAVTSEQTVPHVSPHPTGSSLLSDGHNKGTAETESGGAFGLFKNTFSFFSQTKESTDSAPSLDSNTGEEASGAPDPLSSGRELDSATHSSQVHIQDLHADLPIALPQQQQVQPSPPCIQTSSPSPMQTPSHPSSLSSNTESPLQTKTPSKHYKNLLAFMSVDETTVLMELFGQHKLQFLEYILGSSETPTEDPDDDESILLDIERLLHYHRETLVIPSMRPADAPQEDKEKTRPLIALQKLEILLARVRESFNTGKSDTSSTNHQAEASCVGDSCAPSKEETTTDEESSKMGTSPIGLDDNTPRGKWMGLEGTGEQVSGGTAKGRVTEDEKTGEKDERSEEERVSLPHIQPGSPQPLEGVTKQVLDFVHQIAEDSTAHVHVARKLLTRLTVQVVSALPDDIRPGPDLYGVPWEPVVISSLVGLMTMLLFTCRCYSSVKSRMYQSKERWMAEQVAQLLDEKCKVLETLGKCQQEYEDLEWSLRDSGVLAQTQKTEHLEGRARQLGHAKRELERDLEQLKDQLDQQREHKMEQERRIAVLEESMKISEEETKDLQSQEEQAQTTLKVYNMNSARLQRNLETTGEENALLQESNAQLRQQVEGWAERVSELEAEMSRCEVVYSRMLQDVADKDERIMSLTDRLLMMKAWDSDLEEEEGGGKETSNRTAGTGEENGRGDRMDTQGHLQKVQKLIYAAKLNADLKSVDEDKDRAFAKLNDEVKAKEDLQASIKELENEKLSLQSDAEHYSDQVQRLQQKLQIMTEMYQENELKLHRLLTVEEKERLQKEEKLNKADRNIALAMEELNNYRQRAEEMEEELEKTKQSYQTQIAAHEKKAHNNWLAARAADRDLADIRRENALFRQKLTDTQFKLDALDKDPYALDSLARPLPFRAERSPYGPSPLGRPASETRAFLSPPTLMDGPPARLSPRALRGAVEPPGGHGEMERSGGPHSDSGSNSPTWERDRRGPPPGPPGPLGPPGYMFPEPGGPMYRRPPPPPGALGLLPPLGSLPPGPLHPRGRPPGPPHPADIADGTYRENSLGPGEQEHRESGPGDRRTPPEADPRMGGATLMGPMDVPFPRRLPYGPPPPDFYPARGPGGPPMMPMWAPPPPGMMFPPRFPPGGPLPPPASHSHHTPPMRPLPPDGLLPPSMGPLPAQQSLPSPPHRRSPEERTLSPEDTI